MGSSGQVADAGPEGGEQLPNEDAENASPGREARGIGARRVQDTLGESLLEELSPVVAS